ncbi:MAG TPA: GNAT family N-acetyltransferase [Solirubrobacterales bacterium]|nr:GNAT family N-acetyltransferase [Solirubrobacterales bacterium]
MRTELISPEGMSERDLGRWRELADEAVEPNPFFEPGYVLSLASALGVLGTVMLLIVRDQTRWLACVPVHRVRRWHQIPLQALATWRGHLFFGLLGTPLARADRLTPTLATLLAGLTTLDPGASAGVLEWMAVEGTVAQGMAGATAAAGVRPLGFERFERAVLRRKPEFTYLEETLSPKHRRELRRQWRKLGETAGGEPEVIDLAGDGERAATEFVALEAAGKKSVTGQPIASDPAQVAFFRELCSSFGASGRMQMLALRAGDRTVAMQCSLRAGRTRYLLKVAYDERWARFSPGILLEEAEMRRFHDDPTLTMIDSCADANNATINRLWSDRRTLETIVLPAPGLKGRAVRPMLGAARTMRNRRMERKGLT